jgi:hypothetical protein
VAKELCPFHQAFGEVHRRYHLAIGNLRAFNAATHTGFDFYGIPVNVGTADRDTGPYFIRPKALQESDVYGPIFFCMLDIIAPCLGGFGKEIIQVKSAAQVDAFLAGTFD